MEQVFIITGAQTKVPVTRMAEDQFKLRSTDPNRSRYVQKCRLISIKECPLSYKVTKTYIHNSVRYEVTWKQHFVMITHIMSMKIISLHFWKRSANFYLKVSFKWKLILYVNTKIPWLSSHRITRLFQLFIYYFFYTKTLTLFSQYWKGLCSPQLAQLF